MTQEHIAMLLDDAWISVEELELSCSLSRDWVIEHVQAGVLLPEAGPEPEQWTFSGRDLVRARRLSQLERDFEANPELAGLVADLLDEVERLRVRLRRVNQSSS
jgi:chaperone modulatory protein CbpM